MVHEVFPVGPLQCNCSIVGDAASGETMVIDPGGNLAEIRARLAKLGLRCTQIVVTHAHIDHIAGARRLSQMTGAPVFYNQLDLPLVEMMDDQAAWLGVGTPEVAAPDASAEEGMELAVGGHVGTVLHTPGHTEGSICLHFADENLLIAGDTLFQNSIGRTDLPGGDPKKIMASLRERIAKLPEETKVVPGHGVSTTIGAELESNPFLVAL
ncbi:MAG: MBL fold metallo-hydrolase [Acidobacteria bacterium]|nr:MBL fold metallo-hydrolase [Acidobacteriota bacterium]